MEGWTTESVLKKHNLWRPLAGPDAGATAITLQWHDMRIARLEQALRNWLCETSGDDEDERKAARELLRLSPNWPHDQPGFVSGEYFVSPTDDETDVDASSAGAIYEACETVFHAADDMNECVGMNVTGTGSSVPVGAPIVWTATTNLRFVKRESRVPAETLAGLPTATIRYILQQGYESTDGGKEWVDVPTVGEGGVKK